jgi:hypothetical protein
VEEGETRQGIKSLQSGDIKEATSFFFIIVNIGFG